jgi:hypothetical protein
MKRMTPQVVLGMVLGLALGGCAGIPVSGPIVRVEAPASRTHSTVRYEPARPRAGATPLRIAEGYLDAMLAYPEATGIVEEFLTPQAIRDWDSGSGLNVYSSAVPGLLAVSGNRAQVGVRLRSVMTLDPSGRASLKSSVTTRILELARVDGQWRIDNPVPGYLISQNFARDYVHAYPLWFFDESGRRLVPEMVHAVVSEQLPLTLIHRLADGPRGSTHRTFLPESDGLRVRIIGNSVEIDVRRDLEGSPDKLAAQLLSTLRTVPGLDGIRLLVNGAQERSVDFSDAVVGFGPGSQPAVAYGIRKNKIVALTATAKAMRGPWGRSARGAVDVAVGRDSVAAVLPERDAVAVGPRGSGDVVTIDGTEFVRPEWDDADRLWLIDKPNGVTRVRVVAGAASVGIAADGLVDPESFAVSPDGSRYAATVAAGRDAQVVVGDIEHDADGFPRRLGAPLLVSRGLVGERQIGWASQTRVEFIADTRTTAQLHTVNIDGTDDGRPAGAAALPTGVFGWAGPAAEGADRWALDHRGRVWRLVAGRTWRLVPGASAGGAFTVLSSAG